MSRRHAPRQTSPQPEVSPPSRPLDGLAQPWGNQAEVEALRQSQEPANEIRTNGAVGSTTLGPLGDLVSDLAVGANRKADAASDLFRTTARGANLDLLNGASYGDAQRMRRIVDGGADHARTLGANARSTSRASRTLGTTGQALTLLDVGLSAYQGFTNDTVETTGGKAVNGVGRAGMAGLLTKTLSAPVAAADALWSGAMATPLADLIPEESRNVVRNTSIGGTADAAVDVLASAGEAVTTGNTAGAERFHEGSLAGDKGVLFQTASAAGEAIESVTSGDAARYAERAAAGELGPIAQGMSWVGEKAGEMWFGGGDE